MFTFLFTFITRFFTASEDIDLWTEEEEDAWFATQAQYTPDDGLVGTYNRIAIDLELE